MFNEGCKLDNYPVLSGINWYLLQMEIVGLPVVLRLVFAKYLRTQSLYLPCG